MRTLLVLTGNGLELKVDGNLWEYKEDGYLVIYDDDGNQVAEYFPGSVVGITVMDNIIVPSQSQQRQQQSLKPPMMGKRIGN